MSSRKEQKERAREERLKREQEAKAAEQRKKLVGYVVAGVLAGAVVAAIAIVALTSGGGDDQKAPKGLKEAAAAAGCKVSDYPDFGNSHVETPVRYKTNPPTSGDHFPVPAEDGAYLQPPKTEALVHALEHGRIVVQYAPNTPDRVKDGLKDYFDALKKRKNEDSVLGNDSGGVILVENRTLMPFQVAATAWRHALTCKTYRDPAKVENALEVFKDTYRGHGPEAVRF